MGTRTPGELLRRIFFGGALFVSLALGVCGCSEPVSQTGGSGHLSGSLPTPDPNALVWVLESPPTMLDAARLAADASGAQVAAQVYDRLVRFRPGTVDLAPGIATNWASDPEGRVFTFTLRDGLRFHDGTALDAAAVAWNFQRWMDPSHPAHLDGFVAWRDYFGGFVGEKDDQGRAINLVAEVAALDPRTVRVTLNAPFAPFLHHLAMVPFGLASPAALRAQGEAYGSDRDHLPIGSGPFTAADWSDDGTVILVPYEGYWAGPPTSPGITFITRPSAVERFEAVASGEAHGAELAVTSAITQSATTPGMRVVARPPRSTAWLMLNHSRDPLGDVRIRQAISMAIDRERIAREHFGSEALPANQMLPPGFLGHEEALPEPEYDPPAARQIMIDAGLGDGFKLNIWVASTARGYLPDPTGTAASVAEMLKEIGIDAAVRSENLRQFLMDRDRGRFSSWLIGWEAQSADPDNFWFWHFGAGRVSSEGQYEQPELAANLLDAQRTINTAEREEIYRAAARTVNADVARVFLAHPRLLVAVSNRVRGYEPNPMGFDDLRDVTLAPRPEPGPGATGEPSAVETPTGAGEVITTATVTATPVGGAAEPLETVTPEDTAADAAEEGSEDATESTAEDSA